MTENEDSNDSLSHKINREKYFYTVKIIRGKIHFYFFVSKNTVYSLN
jgi:hypothetical protein